MKGYFKNMKTITKVDFATYLGVILAFIVVSVCQAQGLVNRSLGGMLVPICCYVCMSISLNLTVGILGELSLGHAGFMSVGAFSGIIAAMSLQSAVPNDLVRMIVALVDASSLPPSWSSRIPGLASRGTTGHCHPGLRRDHQGSDQLPSGGLG